jgi:hypothetical protein
MSSESRHIRGSFSIDPNCNLNVHHVGATTPFRPPDPPNKIRNPQHDRADLQPSTVAGPAPRLQLSTFHVSDGFLANKADLFRLVGFRVDLLDRSKQMRYLNDATFTLRDLLTSTS